MAVSEAQTTDDHYATLGVTPRSEDVVIRAAYLALMHRYHPDKSSSASSERAQAIIAAFAVLGDVEKRLRYDWGRRREAEELARPPQPRLTKTHLGLIAASVMALLIVPLAFMREPQTVGEPLDQPTAEPREPTPPRPAPAASVPKPDPVARPIAKVAPVPAPKPDEPARPAAIAEQVAAPRPTPEKPPRVAALAPRAPIERSQRATEAKADKPRANSKCLSARPGADAAVCKNDNLAALDRLAVTFYGQSLKAGNATKRAALLVSRNGFLGRREACRSEPCLRSAYLTHMREISTIVESKQPN